MYVGRRIPKVLQLAPRTPLLIFHITVSWIDDDIDWHHSLSYSSVSSGYDAFFVYVRLRREYGHVHTLQYIHNHKTQRGIKSSDIIILSYIHPYLRPDRAPNSNKVILTGTCIISVVINAALLILPQWNPSPRHLQLQNLSCVGKGEAAHHNNSQQGIGILITANQHY